MIKDGSMAFLREKPFNYIYFKECNMSHNVEKKTIMHFLLMHYSYEQSTKIKEN